MPFRTEPVYAATKHAVVGLTRSLGPMKQEENIRVNCVCPGAITTRIFGGFMDLTEEQQERMLQNLPNLFANAQPLKKAGMPEDIANGVAWLASDASAFVTGHALVIDGGIALHSGGLFSAGGEASQEERNLAFIRAMGLDPSEVRPNA